MLNLPPVPDLKNSRKLTNEQIFNANLKCCHLKGIFNYRTMLEQLVALFGLVNPVMKPVI